MPIEHRLRETGNKFRLLIGEVGGLSEVGGKVKKLWLGAVVFAS